MAVTPVAAPAHPVVQEAVRAAVVAVIMVAATAAVPVQPVVQGGVQALVVHVVTAVLPVQAVEAVIPAVTADAGLRQWQNTP